MSVSVNPPKTPVTKGSNGVAVATIPNVCKMPGPPAPFIPVPLPNIGKSGDSPKGYSKKVKIEGNSVAIKGATFKSIGDIASKGTGGGLISANTHGITKFVGPGSMDVKIEGKNVHFLSDPMLNNCAGGGSPPNAATLLGVIQKPGVMAVTGDECPLCDKAPHEPLKETDETKADAGALSKNYGAIVGKMGKEYPYKYRRPTMLGVVYCKCPKKYADQSGETTPALRSAAQKAGMKYPAGSTDVKARIKEHANNDKVFRRIWKEADSLSKASSKDSSLPASYAPGSCAAQGAMVLTLDDGGLPAALTEQWYHPKGKPTKAPIKFIDATHDDGRWTVEQRQFGVGETVPPCGSCEIILELLLCFEKEDQCKHKGGK